MSFLLVIILSYITTYTFAADCISRYPVAFGKINSGVRAIGIVAYSNSYNYHFYEDNNSLILIKTVAAGYVYSDNKFSPWTPTT